MEKLIQFGLNNKGNLLSHQNKKSRNMQASGTVQSSGSWQQHQGPDAIYSTVALARFHPQAGFPQGCSKLSGKASVYSAPFRRRENAVVPTSPEGRLSFALIGVTPLRCSLLKCEQREGIRCLS